MWHPRQQKNILQIRYGILLGFKANKKWLDFGLKKDIVGTISKGLS